VFFVAARKFGEVKNTSANKYCKGLLLNPSYTIARISLRHSYLASMSAE
jgi:hypothetical protein